MGVQKPAEKPKQKALSLQGFCVAVWQCPETLLFRHTKPGGLIKLGKVCQRNGFTSSCRSNFCATRVFGLASGTCLKATSASVKSPVAASRIPRTNGG